jgi:hypothetical protein
VNILFMHFHTRLHRPHKRSLAVLEGNPSPGQAILHGIDVFGAGRIKHANSLRVMLCQRQQQLQKHRFYIGLSKKNTSGPQRARVIPKGLAFLEVYMARRKQVLNSGTLSLA